MNYNKKINIFLSLKIASIFVSSLSITHLLEVTAVMATVILGKGKRHYKGYKSCNILILTSSCSFHDSQSSWGKIKNHE